MYTALTDTAGFIFDDKKINYHKWRMTRNDIFFLAFKTVVRILYIALQVSLDRDPFLSVFNNSSGQLFVSLLPNARDHDSVGPTKTSYVYKSYLAL